MKLTLRPWRESDAAFVCYMRNNPKLMYWFRQTEPILLEDQKNFIRTDIDYHGQVVELNKKPIGVIAIRSSGQLSVVMDPIHYIYLPELLHGREAWGEVFIDNPILRYLLNAGFKVWRLGCIYKDRQTLLLCKS